MTGDPSVYPETLRLTFTTPIDALAVFIIGLRQPEFEHTFRVFDGTWHETSLRGWEAGIGFTNFGSQVTAVEIQAHLLSRPTSDVFSIDDLYVRFTEPIPEQVPEPAAMGVVIATLAAMLTVGHAKRSRS
jgi:hypothetical protein